MYLEIFDKPKTLNADLLESTIRFYARKLMTSKMLKDLLLELQFTRGLKRHHGDAMMYWNDQEVKPKEFTIEMDSSIGIKTALITLAHEMIHIWQYVTGKMQDGADSTCFWEGIPYDLNEVEYEDHPWEIEAFSKEKDLYNEFKSHMEKKDGKAKARKTKSSRKRTC